MPLPLLEYPRALVVESIERRDYVIAWLRPYALINDKYIHLLPDDTVGEFGVKIERLLDKKGNEAELNIGDVFRTYNPEHVESFEGLEIIGEYLPGVESL